MPDNVRTDLDTPAGYGPSGGPGSALQLPTKHYSESDVAKHPGKHNSLDGPCNNKEGY